MTDPICKNCGESIWLHPELDYDGLVGNRCKKFEREHTTHYACQTRLKRDGANARCCRCEPHEGCDYAPETRLSNPFERVPERSRLFEKKGVLE